MVVVFTPTLILILVFVFLEMSRELNTTQHTRFKRLLLVSNPCLTMDLGKGLLQVYRLMYFLAFGFTTVVYSLSYFQQLSLTSAHLIFLWL